jgi:uncharacterized membrane protein
MIYIYMCVCVCVCINAVANTVMLSKFFYLPTDAQLNCLKNNFKFYIKIVILMSIYITIYIKILILM